MGGCTNCKGKGACDDHKSTMMGSVEAAMEALYPTRVWGEPDDDASPIEPMSADDLDGLAEELATELRAATFVRYGGDDEPCDYIYVLCMGRAPCGIQVRDHGVPVPDEWANVESPEQGIDELYLRVCIAQRTRHAALQQVAVNIVRADVSPTARGSSASIASALPSVTQIPQSGPVSTNDMPIKAKTGKVPRWLMPTGYVIRESPRAGVYDAPLLSRMQKLVAILPAYDLVHVDFGDIAHAPPGFQPGSWPEVYGLGNAKPSIANYLFYPQPTTMVATTYIATGEADPLDDEMPPEDPPSGPHHRADTDRDREDSEDMS